VSTCSSRTLQADRRPRRRRGHAPTQRGADEDADLVRSTPSETRCLSHSATAAHSAAGDGATTIVGCGPLKSETVPLRCSADAVHVGELGCQQAIGLGADLVRGAVVHASVCDRPRTSTPQ